MNNRIDMSLDDIIRNKRNPKKNFNQPQRQQGKNFRANKNVGANKKRIFDLNQKLQSRKTKGDARLTIAVKQRGKIKDARDKLNQIAMKSDARFKIRDKMAKKIQLVKTFDPRTMQQIKQQILTNSTNNPRTVLTGKRGLTRTIPGNLRWRNTKTNLSDVNKRIIVNDDGILVTTRNEMKLRTTRIDQVMDVDDNPMRVRSLTQMPSQPFERSRLSANLRNRLDGNDQMGCKVIVSNLHPSVTQDDIEELFGEIGDLRRATLGKSGTAEIVFSRSIDAQKACDVYHNRQLDGIPMNLRIGPVFGHFRSDSMQSRVAPDAEVVRHALFSERAHPMASNYPRFNVRMNRN